MIDATEPEGGFYRMRLVRGGPLVGIRLWYGQPLEPWTREAMDRAHCWNAEANGKFVELDRVWPVCAGDPIDEREYKFLTARTAYAEKHDGYDPAATPFRRTNWDDSTIPTFGASA